MQLEQPKQDEISGRSIIVTGAASGIGRALALGFARDGALVLGVDRDAERLEEVSASGIRTLVGDVCEETTLRSAVDLAVEAFGRVDVLVNNAGFGRPGKVEDLDAEAFRETIAVHLFAAFYGIKAVAPAMRKRRHGRIINVLSRAAEVCFPANSAYSAGKAALWALTRSAAGELAEDGILVNGLIPGMTNTAIWGRPRPELQEPERVYPSALALATLPEDGPNGRVFWDLAEYRLFEQTIGKGAFRSPATGPAQGEVGG